MATTARMARTGGEKLKERIDIRLRPQQKDWIERAASIKGLTMTDFILQQAVENALETIRDHETWELSRADAELFAAALQEPTVLGPQLSGAAARYKDRQPQR